jgi:hypothetical protein
MFFPDEVERLDALSGQVNRWTQRHERVLAAHLREPRVETGPHRQILHTPDLINGVDAVEHCH